VLKTHTFSYYYLGDNMNKKILIITTLLFVAVIIYSISLIPDKNNNYEYVNSTMKTIYTIDNDNYVSKTNVYEDKNGIDGLKKLFDIMTNNTISSSLLKEGFLPILPKNTKIIDITIDNDILKINFSKELLEINKELEEQMIESIIYTAFENSKILGIEIYVEGKLLKYLPKSLKAIPTILTKDYGINNTYDLTSYDNVNKVLVWFVKEINDEIYYVPVTKYVDDDRNKVEIIIDILSSKKLYKDKLLSFVNNKVNLVNYKLNNKELTLYLEDNSCKNYCKIDNVSINEIVNSLFDSLDLNNVKLFVNKELVGVFKE